MSRVLLRRDANVLRRSYLKGAVGTPAQAMFDDTAQGGGSSLLIRGQFDPSLELNYVDDPRLACGEVFTRATIRTVRDFEGRTLTLNSGEVGFWGMRRVENLLDFTEDATNAYWTKDDITIEANVSSQPGGVSSAPRADKLVETAANSDHRLQPTGLGSVVGRVYVSSFRVKAAERTSCAVQVNGLANSTAIFDLPTATVTSTQSAVAEAGAVSAGDGFVRVWIRWISTGAAQFPELALVAAGATTYAGSPGWGLYFRQCQHQDVSGQSYRGPSEYVSKRVLAAPYHGANVDGVRYFVTDYYGVVIPRYTGTSIKYVQLLGQTAGYVSTPDAAANSVTGDIDIRVNVSLNSLGAVSALVAKYASGVTLAYAFYANGGSLNFLASPDGGDAGTSYGVKTSTVTIASAGFAGGDPVWLRVTRSANSGETKFYTSHDGITWTQLGAAVAGTAGAIFDSSAPLEVGSISGGTAWLLAGIVYRAQVYSGSTLAADFNPNDAAAAGSASLASSTTGETWTINSNGTKARVNSWTKPARWGLFRGRASTNTLLRSDALDNAAWTAVNTTVTANAVLGVDGALNAERVLAAAVLGTHTVAQSGVTYTATSYTLSAHLRPGTNRWASLTMNDGATAVSGSFDLLAGAVGALSAVTTSTIEQLRPGLYRVTITSARAATAGGTATIAVNDIDNAGIRSWTPLGTEDIYATGAQLEALDHATSYIPTAAAAVPRNAELITLATGAWYNQVEGTLAFTGIPTPVVANVKPAVLDDGSTNERVALSVNVGGIAEIVVAGGVNQATVTAGALVADSRFYCAAIYKANDFAVTVNGSALATDPVGSVPAAATQLGIGNPSAGGQEFEGAIARIHYHPARRPDALLPAMLQAA